MSLYVEHEMNKKNKPAVNITSNCADKILKLKSGAIFPQLFLSPKNWVGQFSVLCTNSEKFPNIFGSIGFKVIYQVSFLSLSVSTVYYR